MTCQTCLSFKRRDTDSGECFNADAAKLHEFFGRSRFGVTATHGCTFHVKRAEVIEKFACQFRAAFRGVEARD